MTMDVSLKDVAAQAGVSFQTVSKVLRGSGVTISHATRERVLAAAKELGYVPNVVARGLVSQSSYTLGFLADDLGDWALSQYVTAAEHEARARGQGFLVTVIEPETDPTECVQMLIEHRVDGIIAASPHLERSQEAADLLRRRTTVGLVHLRGGGVSLVGSDQREVGRLATRHLLELGHRRIATVTGPSTRHAARSRLTGYRQALQAAGVELDRELIEMSDWTAEGGDRATRRLLETDRRLTAVVVQNDLMAIGVLHALHDLGVAVPDEVAVVGCDDLPVTAYTTPPLTTIHLPFAETGATAVDLLLRQIEHRDEAPRRVLLPLRLVARVSSGARVHDHRPLATGG